MVDSWIMMVLLDLRLLLLCWIYGLLMLVVVMLLVCFMLFIGFGGLFDTYVCFLLAIMVFFGGSTAGFGGYTGVGFMYSSSYTIFSSLTGRWTFYYRAGSLIGAIV